MPKIVNGLPKYRRHSSRNVGFAELAGQRTYFKGAYGSDESRSEYKRFCLEWETQGRPQVAVPKVCELTIVELLSQYIRWAKKYYGRESREIESNAIAFRPLKEFYGRAFAAEFGPKALKAVRQKMIDADLCRNEVNKRVGRIKRMFKWAVSEELIPNHVFHGLQSVRGLARGRSEARESEKVKPVPDAYVDAIKEHVSPQIWAMIELQRYTGARPGEIANMRTVDIDTTGEVWTYTPTKHKTSHHGHERKIYFGPKAKAVLQPWLRLKLDEHLFQPCEAVEWQRQQRRAKRITPIKYGNSPGTNRKKSPKRTASDRYSTNRYSNAIRRACVKAGVPNWHPHQLRHNAATFLRKQYGLDVARAILGHRSAAVTEWYAELDGAQAIKIMREIG